MEKFWAGKCLKSFLTHRQKIEEIVSTCKGQKINEKEKKILVKSMKLNSTLENEKGKERKVELEKKTITYFSIIIFSLSENINKI